MAQNVVDFSGNPTGAGLMDDYLDKEQQNVLTSNSGIQRPSYAVAGTKWLDTLVTPWLWKMYDGTNDVTLGTVNPSTHLFTPAGVLPSQEGQSGKFLQTNGSNTIWADAVDYNDYAEADAQNVKLTGTQAITGRKNFVGSGIGIVKSGSAIDIQNKNVDLSVTDGSVYGTSEIHFIDKNNIVQGIFEHQNRTNGDSVMIMAVRNHADTTWESIEVGFDKNDNVFTKVPTPATSSNNTSIATTQWVRNYGAILDYSAAVTISGTGTKTASVNGVLIGTPINNNSSESLKITIDGKTFYFAPGNSGEDNNHMSQCYLPIAKGQSYNVVEINGNVQLLLVPYV